MRNASVHPLRGYPRQSCEHHALSEFASGIGTPACRAGICGVNTGGGRSNAEYLAERVTFEGGVDEATRALLFDPQTSGGLLIAVAPDRTEQLLEELEREGVNTMRVIGQITPGDAGRIRVERG